MIKKNNSPYLNPYRHAGTEFLKRLLWDLNFESFRSRKKISKIKDKYIGKKAVIICNGPSLLKTDFSLLENVFTFGLNKINLLFDKTDFRPSCIVSVNKFVIEQNKDFYNQTIIPLFLDNRSIKHIQTRENIIFIHSAGYSKFARD